MKSSVLILFLVFSFNFTFAQDTISDQISSSDSYQDYFKLPRKSLYLHLNKSSYLRGEKIWFQGYAYNRKTQNLDLDTRNVKVGLYNDAGEVLDKKLFLSIGGLFTGQISIDSTFTDGEYYLKAETNYMKNFKEDYAHVQRFEVLGEELKYSNARKRAFDLKLLPEGGTLVYGCKGNLGLKLINQNGQGIRFDAELYENENSIFTFSSNSFGHASVNFVPSEENNYTVELKLPDGNTIRKDVEDIEKEGFVLSVNNLLQDKTIINVSTNYESYVSADTKLMIHQEGKYFEVPLEIKTKKSTISKSIDKSKLFKGVNTITFLVNDKPIAERLIFNRTKVLGSSDDIQVSLVPKTNRDSINLNLNIAGLKKSSNLSISVLPKNTISYVKNQNISSSFLLDPFVNGHVENKTYYFKNANRRVDFDLDLLLMIQGWSKYKWDNIKKNAPQYAFKEEEGITQNVIINSRIRRKFEKFLVYGTIYNEAKVFNLDDDSEFILKNRYPFIGEKMEFSFITKKQDFEKPELDIEADLNLVSNTLPESQRPASLSKLRSIKLDLSNEQLYSSFLRGERLEEVTVESKNNEIESENFATSFKDNTVTVDEDFANTYAFLSDYLSTKGFIVGDVAGSFSIRSQSRISLQGSNAPTIFLNGILLNDISILAGSRTSDYEEIFVDRSGYGAGVQGAAGVIRLKQRTDALFTGQDREEEETFSQHEVKKGFEPPKLFYTPEYAFFQTESFQQIGTIGWFPDVKTSPEESFDLQIFDTGLTEMTLFIEGIARDGSLINITKDINLEEEKEKGLDFSVLQSYFDYFDLPRESLYLHLNKSSYLRGENIWFQGYAYNRKTQNLNKDTRNVEIGVYDDNGNLLDKKLFLSREGLFKGQIEIDSTFTDGNYYLKAETNYMKNFKEDYAHVQNFEVIGEEQVEQKQILKDFDLQVLPESGYSVLNCKSNLGVKLLNSNGLGVEFKATLYEDDKPKVDFESNTFGMAKVEFLPKEGKTYKLKVTLPNGDIIEKSIEDIKQYGFVINANVIESEEKKIVNVSYNLPDEFEDQKNNFTLMVHQEGKHFNIPIEIKSNNAEIPIVIEESKLFYGVNTLTLFKNDKPIAERLIFNDKKTLSNSNDVELNFVETKALDSLALKLSLNNIKSAAKLSISVLPSKTISYVKNQNISSAFLLDPFVQGYIENKPYYFTEQNQKTRHNLDLLLLTQGWSQYEWDTVFDKAPKVKYFRLNGISQEITINDKIPGRVNQILFWGDDTNDSNVININENFNTYTLYERFPLVGDTLEVSFVDKKQRFIKPDLSINNGILFGEDPLLSHQLLKPISNLRNIKPELSNDRIYDNFMDGEILDEVVIEADPKWKKNTFSRWMESDWGEYTEFDEDLVTRFPTLLEYLATKNYYRVGDRIADRPIATEKTRYPAVFLNGLKLRNLDILFVTRTQDFEEIYIDRSWFFQGVITLWWRKTPLFNDFDDVYPLARIVMENGFEPQKDFYTPKYKFFNTPVFEQSGTIAWFPEVSLEVGETIKLAILDTKQKNIKLFIEGITEDGSLINVEKILENR